MERWHPAIGIKLNFATQFFGDGVVTPLTLSGLRPFLETCVAGVGKSSGRGSVMLLTLASNRLRVILDDCVRRSPVLASVTAHSLARKLIAGLAASHEAMVVELLVAHRALRLPEPVRRDDLSASHRGAALLAEVRVTARVLG